MKRLIAVLFFGALACAAQPAPAPQAVAQAQQVLGWRVGLSAYTFRNQTFFDAVDAAAALGQQHIEGYFRQKVSPAIAKNLDFQLEEAEAAAVARKLNEAGVSLSSYYFHKMPADEAGARRLFAFAQKLGVETIVSEPEPESLDMLEKLCAEYRVNLAIHNHTPKLSPVYWDPENVLKIIGKRSRRIGVCGDAGAWIRSGVKPAAAMALLKNRLLAVHLHDLNGAGEAARDVPLGTGMAGVEELLKEAYRLELKPLHWTVEYVSSAADPRADVAQSLAFLGRSIVAIAGYHQNYISRTQGVRRFSEITPEERQRVLDALPAKAPAKPKKPRRLLVVDLNLGRFGHPSIPYANLAIGEMGKRTGAYEAVFSNDPAMLEAPSLKSFDAVFLNNTIGDLFGTPARRVAFRDFIRNGGGLVANHAVTVTATDWPEFGEILGARGASHRVSDEKVTLYIEDPEHPLTSPFVGQSLEIADEFFRYQEPYSRDKVRVLLSIDTAKTDMNQGRCAGNCTREDGDYPVSWIRRHGEGRVFYTTMGHNPGIFWHPRVLGHFLAGIQFALGDLDASTAPLAARKPR